MAQRKTPQDEAIEILGEVLRDLRMPQPDLRTILLSCLHACNLAGWSEQASWFRREVNGYAATDDLPSHRKNIIGSDVWSTGGDIEGAIHSVVYRQPLPPTESVRLDLYEGIAHIISWAQSGSSARTGKTQQMHAGRIDYEAVQFRTYSAGSFKQVIQRIEEITFDWASATYSALRYGNALANVWDQERALIEPRIATLGLDAHFFAIERGLQSTNPEEWRNVLWKCRDMLHDLAARLWQDPRPTYKHLPGKTESGELAVTASDYVNRLGAYMHQKGLTGTLGHLVRAETDRIYGSISALNDMASSAHGGQISLDDAQTVSITTYHLIAELIRRTDMEPITEYSGVPPSGTN